MLNTKKIIGIFLAVCFVLSVTVASVSAAPAPYKKDDGKKIFDGKKRFDNERKKWDSQKWKFDNERRKWEGEKKRWS